MSDPLSLSVEIILAAAKVLAEVAPDAFQTLKDSNGAAIDAAIEQARTALPPRWDTARADAERRKAVLDRKHAAAEAFAKQLPPIGFKVRVRDAGVATEAQLDEVDVAGERIRVGDTWIAFDDVKL